MENTKNLLNKKQDPRNFWEKIQSEMIDKFGKDIFDSWLRKIKFVEEFNNYILLSVPTRFIRDWITSRYMDQILQIVKTFKKEISRIEISIDENLSQDQKNIHNANKISESQDKNNVSFINT